MSKWGVFKDADAGEIAVAPIDMRDNLLSPHTGIFDRKCVCNPSIQQVAYGDMIVHNDPERGGFNA